VKITFDSDEQLSTVSVSISDAESATLTASDFAETDNGDGTYSYAATYAGGSEGTYTATLDTAADAAGNDGASGESASASIDTTVDTVDAGPDQTVASGETATLDATGSSDASGIATYEWDYGNDGTVDARGATVDHEFFAPGEHTVGLTVVDGNGTLRATRTDIEVARGGTPFLLTRSSVSAPRYDVNAPYSDAMIYHDGDAAFYRLVAADNATYGTDAGATAAEVESDRTGSDAVLGLLTTFRWEVTRLEIGGAVRYRLESTAVVAPDALDDAYLLTDPRDAEVRMLVGPDGRVYRYRLEYETTYDGRRAGVTETARWSDVGTTTVDPPGWLDRARNESVGAPSEGETRP